MKQTSLPFNLLAAHDRIFGSELGPSEKLVALAILKHWSSEFPRPMPGVERLAAMTSLGEKTVRRAIDALERAGIRVQRHHRRSHTYEIQDAMGLPQRRSAGHHDRQDDGGLPVTTTGNEEPCRSNRPSLPVKSSGFAGHGDRPIDQGRDQKKKAAAAAIEDPESAGKRTPTAKVQTYLGPEHFSRGGRLTKEEINRRDAVLEAAAEDHDRRMALRKSGDPSWCAEPSPEWLLGMYVVGIGKVFGEEQQEASAEKLLRAWPSAVSAAERMISEFALTKNAGLYLYDFVSWFMAKQNAKKSTPGHTPAGWGLLLNCPGVVDEYKNMLRTKRRPAPKVA